MWTWAIKSEIPYNLLGNIIDVGPYGSRTIDFGHGFKCSFFHYFHDVSFYLYGHFNNISALFFHCVEDVLL